MRMLSARLRLDEMTIDEFTANTSYINRSRGQTAYVGFYRGSSVWSGACLGMPRDAASARSRAGVAAVCHTWRLRGAVGPASAWGQGSAPISPPIRSGKCWRITRGEPLPPPRAPCRTSGAALSLGRDHTQTAPGRRSRTPSSCFGRRRRRTATNLAADDRACSYTNAYFTFYLNN